MKPLDAVSSSMQFICYFHFPCTSSLILLFITSPCPPLFSSSHLPLYFFSTLRMFQLFTSSSSFSSSPSPLLLSREVLSSCQALNKPQSFIHDVLITNSVINTLPNQSFSSIMADQSGLMLHRKLLDGLLGVNNVHKVREFDIGLDRIE